MNTTKLRLELQKRSRRPGKVGALVASTLYRIAPRGSEDIEIVLWGRKMTLPAGHHLPFIVGMNPMWSMPLAHCAAALQRAITVIDVGANVGDSVALLESFLGGQCTFVCIEPNPEWQGYLARNTEGLPVEIVRTFIGEGQLVELLPGAPGTAGTRVAERGERSVSLDSICSGKNVDLIKVDTDGFDFPVLRSASRLLASQFPALFFEWDAHLWREQGENPLQVFDWLARFGYEHFCVFSDSGFFSCRFSAGQREVIESLVTASDARRRVDTPYLDVLAAASEVCDRAVENNIKAVRAFTTEVKVWNRLQPAYWQ